MTRGGRRMSDGLPLLWLALLVLAMLAVVVALVNAPWDSVGGRNASIRSKSDPDAPVR